MSFRDTFTRSQSSSENLQYDDNAAYHFYTTILLLVFIPLIYSITKTVLNPFGHIPRLKQIEGKPHFAKKIAKFKRDNRFSYLSCWFVVKILLTLLIIYSLINCFIVLSETGEAMKGFDPYEILEVDPDTPVEKIRKSYRKLALKYHPDRNPGDPQANAKFIMISKAYECLTDENAKQNCLKFGNPQGSTSFNVGIALPSFLVHKDNKVIIMGFVFLLVVIVLPIFLIYYFGEVNKFDENGMLQESHPFIHSAINQQLSIRDCIKTLALCAQFKNLKINKAQSEKLQILLRQADQDMKKVFMKKKFFNYIKKSMVLIDARVSEKKIPEQLMEDFRFIMRKIPVLVKASVTLGLQRSNQMIARYRPEMFVGGNALKSLIMFGQYFIQGKSLESQSFQQLDLTEEEIDRIYKKKKKRLLTSLSVLKTNEQERQFFLSILDPQRGVQIKQILEYMPLIQEISCIIHTAGEKELTALDVLQVIVNIKANRKSNFCTALKYPFLKMEGWYILITEGNHVVHLEHFSFDTSTEYEVKFNRGPYQKAGNYSLNVHVLSDCYYGLDVERIAKFEIGQARKMDAVDQTTQEQQEQGSSFFDRIMKGMMPQQEEELSDKEDEEETAPKDQKKSTQEQSSSKIQLEQKNQ